MSNWVDFKAIKDAVSLQAVLDHYGITKTLQRNGQELRGRCPIHRGEGTDTFHANLHKNVFQCFSCKARGNVLDLVAAIEKCSVRDAGLKLKDWFGLRMGESVQPSPAPVTTKARAETGSHLAPEKVGDSAEPNKPLAFTLKGIDPTHPYLKKRGISEETARAFGMGLFPGKGSMAGRVVIPVHNEKGELVAYAGRSIDTTEPKYKFPPGFKKSQVVYNLDGVLASDWQARELDGVVVVVEGFFDCINVSQAGFPAVALMGCSLSGRWQPPSSPKPAEVLKPPQAVAVGWPALISLEPDRAAASCWSPRRRQICGTGALLLRHLISFRRFRRCHNRGDEQSDQL